MLVIFACMFAGVAAAATLKQGQYSLGATLIGKLTKDFAENSDSLRCSLFWTLNGGCSWRTFNAQAERWEDVALFIDPVWSRMTLAINGDRVAATSGWGSGDGWMRRPQHVEMSASGQVFVSDTGNNRVQVWTYSTYNQGGVIYSALFFRINVVGGATFSEPQMVRWDDGGTLGTGADDYFWVLDGGGARIVGYKLIIDGQNLYAIHYVTLELDSLCPGPAGVQVPCFAMVRAASGPAPGLSFATGTLLLFDAANNRFIRLTVPRGSNPIPPGAVSSVVTVSTAPNPQGHRFGYLEADPWGNVFCVDRQRDEIVKYSSSLEILDRFGVPGTGPIGTNELNGAAVMSLQINKTSATTAEHTGKAILTESWGPASGVQLLHLGVDARDLQLANQSGSLALNGSWLLTDAARVRTEICHTWGTTIRTVEDEVKLSAGTQSFTWDGLNDAGAVVPLCRNYLVRIRAISLYESPDTVTITREFYHKPPIQKTLTVLGSVPGAQANVNDSTVAIGGMGYALPCSVCTSVDLEVPPTQTLSGVKYCFDTWSDSGFRARSLELRWDSTTTAVLVPTGSAPIPLSDGAVLFPDLLDCRSPHKILGDVTAPNGLTVHPGTTVRFMRTGPQGTTGVLRVSKYLTATDAIFETVDSTQNNVPAGEWAGILVNDPTGAAIAIRSCTVRNAIAGLGAIDGGTVSSVTIEDCVFSENFRDIDVAFVDGPSPGKSLRLARNYFTATTTQVKAQGADQAGDPWIAATIDTNTFAPSQNGSTMLKLTGGFAGNLNGNNLNLSPSNSKGIELGGAGTAYPNVVLRFNRFQNSSGRIALLSPGVAGPPVIDAQNNNWWQFSGEEIEDVITHYGSEAPDSPTRKAVVYIPFLTGGGAGGPGCPYVFAEADGQFVVQNSILSRGHFGPGGGPPVWDAVELPNGDRPEDGTARLRIKEMGADTDMLDAVRVTAVRSPEDVRFATDPEGGIRAYRTLATLSGARSWTGRDAPFISPIAPTQAYRGAPGDSLEFDVVGGDGIAIGRRFGFSLIPKPQEAPPIGGRVGVTVRVSRDADGATWETLGDIVPREFWSTEVLAAPGLESGSVRRVRVVWNTPHLLGWAGLVEEVPVEQRILPTVRASHSDGTDATTRLSVADGRSATVRPGEYLEVVFDASDLRPDERSVVAVNGHYTSPSPGTEPVVPARAFASQNRPNPFNPRTEIEFGLPAAGRVVVRVYDVAGRLVRELVNREYPPGTHTISWDGRDRRGADAASGVYFYQARVGDGSFRHRMVLLR